MHMQSLSVIQNWDNNKIPNSKVHSHTVPARCPCTYMTVPRVMCGLHLSTAIPWSLLRLNKHDKWTQGNGLLHKGQARVYVYNSLLFIVYRNTADCLFIFLSKNCMVGWGRSGLRVNILCKQRQRCFFFIIGGKFSHLTYFFCICCA